MEMLLVMKIILQLNCIKILRNVTKSTHDKIRKLFDKFSYQYDFKWEDVAELFNVKKSRASEIVALLLNSNLIESSIQQNINLKNKK